MYVFDWRRFSLSLLGVLPLLIASCGGGGGGGGGNGGGSVGRTTSTGLRIVHAGIDAAPVTFFSGDGEERKLLQTARYTQLTNYAKADEGPQTVTLEKTNSPGSVVTRFPADLKSETEYTLYLFGEAGGNGLLTVFHEDLISRPELGQSFVSIANGFIKDTVSVTVGELAFANVSYASISDYQTSPSGVVDVVVTNSSGGVLASFQTTLPDRGEVTLVIAGSSKYGVVFTPVYTDLD